MPFIYAIILLGIIIFVHELGHFLLAKFLKVKVLKFSLGFGPKVIGKKIGETEYLISSIPFGGYVKMLGESPEDELSDYEKPYAYNHQPVWKRFLIVIAGPLFNILFAVIVFFFVFMYGIPILLPDIGEVLPDSPASRLGLIKGDRILEINGVKINQWDEMTEIIHKSPGKQLNIKLKRGEDILQYSIIPEKKKVKDIFGEERDIGLIGVKPLGTITYKKETVYGAFTNSILRTWDISKLTVLSIIKLIQRVIPFETIGGPILIVQMAGEQVSKGFLNFFIFIAIININLGILNLLPIPILDGGHIVFLSIEAIRRRPLSEKIIMISQKIGLAFILTVMIFVLYNDIMRIITNKPLF
jgi:regulator of sigma E protease